jgi:hypothetical protein
MGAPCPKDDAALKPTSATMKKNVAIRPRNDPNCALINQDGASRAVNRRGTGGN